MKRDVARSNGSNDCLAHGGSAGEEELRDAANQVRELRHRLQVELMRMAVPGAFLNGPAANHDEIAWVHDQVMTRPFIAQIVTQWFTQVRCATRAQVRALQDVAELVGAIEALTDDRQLESPRMVRAAAMHVIDHGSRR